MLQKLAKVVIPSGINSSRSQTSKIISFNTSPIIAYPSSKSVTIYDPIAKTSFNYTNHKDEVTALSIHPKDYYLASGDASGQLIIWSLTNENLITKLQLSFPAQISHLSFSEDGKNLTISAKNFYQLSLETELLNELPSISEPSALIYSQNCSVLASQTGEINFFKGRKLAFQKSLDVKIGVNCGVKMGQNWVFCGKSGAVVVVDSEFAVCKELTVCGGSIFSVCVVGEFLAFGCADGKLRVFDKEYKVVSEFGFEGSFYSNQVLGMVYQEFSKKLYLTSFSGKFVEIPFEKVQTGGKLEEYLIFIGFTKGVDYVLNGGENSYQFSQNKIVQIDKGISSVVHESKFDQICQNQVLFAEIIDDKVIGFTSISEFSIENNVFSQTMLNVNVKSVSKDGMDYYLFASKNIIKISNGEQKVLLQLVNEELISGDYCKGQIVIATTQVKGVEIGQIKISDDLATFTNACTIFHIPIFVKFVQNQIFAGSNDQKFVIFEVADFEKDEPWPTQSRLDNVSKYVGRIVGVQDPIIFGSKGLVSLENNKVEKSIEFQSSVSSLNKALNIVCLNNGQIISID